MKKTPHQKALDKELHPNENHKELGNEIFAGHPSKGYDNDNHKKYMSMSPAERRKVNTHMGRLHRRKNK